MAQFMDLNTRKEKLYIQRLEFLEIYSEEELRARFRFGREAIEVCL